MLHYNGEKVQEIRGIMRVTHSRVYVDRHGRRMKGMTFAQRATLRKVYLAQYPAWRYPLVGYILCPFIVALAIMCTLFLQKVLGSARFSGSFLILAILFLALFW